MAEQLIGVVTHYFGKIKVAALELTAGELSVGDTIHIDYDGEYTLYGSERVLIISGRATVVPDLEFSHSKATFTHFYWGHVYLRHCPEGGGVAEWGIRGINKGLASRR